MRLEHLRNFCIIFYFEAEIIVQGFYIFVDHIFVSKNKPIVTQVFDEVVHSLIAKFFPV